MPRMNLKQIAYQTIKDKILTCEFEPNSFLNEDILCRDLNMSRTPIRDALGRLEQEHLITILPKKGFLISSLSIPEINMVYEGRYLIEPYIISNYCNNLPESVILQLQECLIHERESVKNSRSDIFQLDNEFHNLIITQCTNRYFLNLYEELHNQNCRLCILSGKFSNQRLKTTLEEHEGIFRELAMNNTKAAAENMRQHIIHSKEAAFFSIIHNKTSSAETDIAASTK